MEMNFQGYRNILFDIERQVAKHRCFDAFFIPLVCRFAVYIKITLTVFEMRKSCFQPIELRVILLKMSL